MGLDINYYKLGKKIEIDDNVDPWSADIQKQYGDIIRIGNNYGFDEQLDGIEEGFYQVEIEGSFRAGSYSGYNWWREMLVKLKDIALDENDELKSKYSEGYEPFELLVEFSDCDGVIGPFTASKLYNDFKNFEKPIIWDIIKMSKYGVRKDLAYIDKNDLEYFKVKYQDWLECFEKTAGVGVVLFT